MHVRCHRFSCKHPVQSSSRTYAIPCQHLYSIGFCLFTLQGLKSGGRRTILEINANDAQPLIEEMMTNIKHTESKVELD